MTPASPSTAKHQAKTYSRYSLSVKKWAYLMFLLPLSLPLSSAWIGQYTDQWDLAAFYTPLWYFVIIPALDWLIGKDPANPAEEDEAWLSAERFYKVLTLVCLPLYLALLVWGAWMLVTAPFSWVGMVGWTISMGLVGGVAAINTGHELIHKPTRLEQWAGGLLLAAVSYGSFKVEHIYGHHVDVATPRDGSTARLGETIYGFVPRAFWHNPARAFQLEREAFARRNRRWTPLASELVAWYGASLLYAATCVAVVALFTQAPWWVGLAYFAGQSVVAIALLEIINFVEHYGLARALVNDGPLKGRYERVNVTHSWNSNFALTNLLLFQLQRHSDHHAHASRRYQALRHFDESPQLPAGYATMVVLAAIPPLWRRIMDPRVAAYRAASRAAMGAAQVSAKASLP
ncbi:alkane 1-monooxygenase [Piscinibacterium candidicorallinum]|uniref:Alkane 1-monooxygenase n=1 Tax=Piscinibacterium candidicorallinum TaxID=1793872 RepID=A0ABV7H2V3_9BURK